MDILKSIGKFIFWLIIILILIVVLIYFLFDTKETVSYDMAKWDYIQSENDFLPSISDLGNYEEISCKNIHKEVAFLFESDAYIIRASYTPQEYKRVVASIEGEYDFEQGLIDEGGRNEKLPSFELEGFRFKLLSFEEYELEYPKQIVFVGTSPEFYEIAFVYYCDEAMVNISVPFDQFLIEECGWELEDGADVEAETEAEVEAAA